MAKPKHGEWLPGFTEARSGMGGTQGRMGWTWNKDAFGSGKGGWVQMGPNGPTGQVKKYATDTNLVAGTINTVGRVSKFGAKWLTPLGPTIRAIERLKIGKESDTNKSVNKKPENKPFVQRIKRADGSNASLSETFDTGEKNYKPNLDNFKLTPNNKTNKGKLMFGVPIKEWALMTKNQRKYHKRASNNRANAPAYQPRDNKWTGVNSTWSGGRGLWTGSKVEWNKQKEELKEYHQAWLREKGRIK